MLSKRKQGYFTGNANSLQLSTCLAVPIYPCLIALEGTSTIANKVSPFDEFKTKSLQTRWDLRTTNIVSMNLTNILTV